MDPQLLLKIAFDRRANVLAVVVVLGTAWLYLPFYIFLCAVCGLIIFFVVGVRPNARRNRDAWSEYFPRQGAERVQFVGNHHFREWRLPLIVIVHSSAAFSVTRSLPYWNHEAFDNASICVSLPSRVLPLARYVLWRLGGVLPASRSVLLRLLGERTVEDNGSNSNSGNTGNGNGGARNTVSGAGAPAAESSSAAASSSSSSSSSSYAATGVVVAFYDGSKLGVGQNGAVVECTLSSKSVISAALKTGAHVAAAVQLPEGTIFVGKPQQLLVGDLSSKDAAGNAPASTPTGSGGVVIADPSVEQVLAASEEYCRLLQAVLQKAYPGAKLDVRR